MKLSKKKTTTAANNTGGFDELENIKNKDSFEMPDFSNPAKVDVSNLHSFIMSSGLILILILNFVGESCQMNYEASIIN